MDLLRNFCFTVNNPVFPYEYFRWIEQNCRWCIVGAEIAKTGTPHHQGYAVLRERTRFNTVKQVCGWHIESRRGTHAQARDYCKKDGDYYEYGVEPNPGHRTDLDAVRELVVTDGMRGATMEFGYQACRFARMYLTYHEPVRRSPPAVFWICGPSGCGKTRLAREICEGTDTYTKRTGGKWWDGYDGQTSVIIDDWRPDWWPFEYLLGLLDRYEMRIEDKGGSRQFRGDLICVTSILHPRDCANYWRTEPIEQLLRRIGSIEILGECSGGVPEVEGNTNLDLM